MKRTEFLEMNPSLIAQMQEVTQEELEAALKATDDILDSRKLKEALVGELIRRNRSDLLALTIEARPKMLAFVPEDHQTLEMCVKAFSEDQSVIVYCGKQTSEMCESLQRYVIGGYNVFPRLKRLSAEMCVRAVKEDGRNLKHIPQEMQTTEIVKTAVDEWTKAIRWADLANARDMEEVQICALEKNIQSIEAFEPVSAKVVKRLEDLCRTGNYFPSNMKLSFSQEELLQMIIEKKDNGAVAGKLFKLLNDENKARFLRSDGVSMKRFAYLTDLSKMPGDLKLRAASYQRGSASKLAEEEILICLSINPEYLREIADMPLSDEFWLKAAKHNKKALKQLRGYSESFLKIV